MRLAGMAIEREREREFGSYLDSTWMKSLWKDNTVALLRLL